MATYKQPCVHCGTFVERDARICSTCYSRNPFGFACPNCLHPIAKGQAVCSHCGRVLYVTCPTCGAQTFAGERCEACGEGLMIPCNNPRCGQLQFFENKKCTSCGKKLSFPKR